MLGIIKVGKKRLFLNVSCSNEMLEKNWSPHLWLQPLLYAMLHASFHVKAAIAHIIVCHCYPIGTVCGIFSLRYSYFGGGAQDKFRVFI